MAHLVHHYGRGEQDMGVIITARLLPIVLMNKSSSKLHVYPDLTVETAIIQV